LFLGGRGAGKTRAGAEWVGACARFGRVGRFALVGPTFHDVREVMIEGGSGLRAREGERPVYEASRRRLLWANGAQAYCFSAEDPESLRGPQFDAAWCDELAYWAHPQEALDTLSHALRLGKRPRMAVTTTPRPIKALKRLMKLKDTAVTSAATWDNEINLAPGFIAAMRERWTGSVRDRQELLGEMIDDPTGALWRRADLEAARATDWPPLQRIVVAVDPPVGIGPRVDSCGIIAVGAYDAEQGGGRRYVVLADASVQGLAPGAWAARAASLAKSLGAECIVAEANNGGELVRAMLAQAAPEIPIRLTHARLPKRARAEPVAMLYARGRVVHAAVFPELEDEMCAFGAPGFTGSPDRLDALVWAVFDLTCNAEPGVRRV
jgi:phage terminase large subunit-like protein